MFIRLPTCRDHTMLSLMFSVFGDKNEPFSYICTGSPEVAVTGQVLENLPPIGVFWDIENCSVPTGRSAVAVVQRIREKFFKGHREAEFICVCDISKENKEVIQELNNCQVSNLHQLGVLAWEFVYFECAKIDSLSLKLCLVLWV